MRQRIRYAADYTLYMKKTLLITLLTLLTMTAWADGEATPVYADNSVLRSGRWAKIQVSETGINRLTADVVRQAGFTDISKVKIYGYGGALVPEKLTQDYLREHDDLKEIPTCLEGGVKYFFGQGSVSWSNLTTTQRTRNPYYDYGCYFITQSDGEPLSISAEDLLAQQRECNAAHHFLYEKDQYAWEQIGRNLVDGTAITVGGSRSYNVVVPKGNTSAELRVVVTTLMQAECLVTAGSSVESTVTMKPTSDYDKAVFRTVLGSIDEASLAAAATDEDGNYVVPVTVSCQSGGPLRIDYIAASFSTSVEPAALGSTYPAAEYVYNITNQNHHADDPVDMLIIIPTSQNTLAEAETLAELHRTLDGMTVRIVPADELYNEFSSGTPDVSAYRRYLKMYYDKDDTEDREKTIRTCLLFGDCVWDNRMLTLPKSTYNPDNYLLGYQTENSYNLINSIVSDDFIGVLQDNMTIHADGEFDRSMEVDVATGRFPVSNSKQAKVLVDKVAYYMNSGADGAWQNELMFIGDDGDNNSHMKNLNVNADAIAARSPGYTIKKVMFDAYEKLSTSTGERYPDVEEIVKKQQNNGALVMNYGGHGTWVLLGHEKILQLADFEKMRGTNYSLWFTAACETVPFAMTDNTIGEASVLNPDGGAVAFVGTVGTVLEEPNSRIDKYFMKYVLSYDEGGMPVTVGEALRMAKNSLTRGDDLSIGSDRTINKHHYHLLGDPAMRLAIPAYRAVVDYINDTPAAPDDTEDEEYEMPHVMGSSVVTVKGHIEGRDGSDASFFNGVANITVKDSRQTITCRNQSGANTPFTYKDYDSNLFVGTCSVIDGEFTLTFRMPRDIYNDGGCGMITVYAKDTKRRVAANGETTNFVCEGWTDVVNDNVGPSICAYLNSPMFTNGGEVGYTPYFIAEVSDRDGVNVTGSGIGHNMELVVDGDADMTYNLNDNFVFDEDSYVSGQTYYILPTLSVGTHKLTFRAWDLLNNSSTVTLDFRVVKGMRPTIDDVMVSPNPIRGTATFYVQHDMRGSSATVYIDIIDMSGRVVETLHWDNTFSETSVVSAYKWTPSGVSPGLYLYRVRLSADGSEYVSKTKKLIIAN